MQPVQQGPYKEDPAQERDHMVRQHERLAEDYDALSRDYNASQMRFNESEQRPRRISPCTHVLIAFAATGWIAAGALAYLANRIYTNPVCKIAIDVTYGNLASAEVEATDSGIRALWKNVLSNGDDDSGLN